MTPRSETEARLCAMWSDLLGIEEVGVEDDFLDLGGDSFLAIRLLGQIRTEFERSLEIPEFFENPRISLLASLIDGEDRGSKFRRLVPIRFDREKARTHEFEGTFVFAFATTQIMERLQLRFPVYTVSIDWTFGNLDYSEGVHELAKHHVDELLEADPVGPYRLAGFSFGGIIAYEMACLMQKKGRRVEFLLLLDSLLPFSARRDSLDTDGAMHGALADENGSVIKVWRKSSWERFLETPMLEKPSWVWQRRGGFRTYTLRTSARTLRALFMKGLWPRPTVPKLLRKEWALICKEMIWREYAPEPFDGDMIFFVAEKRVEEVRAYWSNLVKGNLDCRAVPVVDHDDVLLEPESLRLIRSCLDELLASPREASGLSSKSSRVSDADPPNR